MVPAKTSASLSFSEPVAGLSRATIQLRVDGVPVSAKVHAGAGGQRANLVPDEPLPVGTRVSLWLSDQLRDAAGNGLTTAGWTFHTAPGTVYDPSRPGSISRGPRSGYRINQDGALLGVRTASLAETHRVSFGQRAMVPNLPGRWLLAETGALAGRWLRESPSAHLDGLAERRIYPPGLRIRARPATHVGYRFTVAGEVSESRTVTLAERKMIEADARAIINGRAYWRLAGGRLDGYWIAESKLASKPGVLGRMDFALPPEVDLAPGTHTAYRYSRRGLVIGSESISPARMRAVLVVAWAIVNGRRHYLVGSGGLAGYWLPESSVTPLHV
jgi:hypothetical protein